MCSLPLTGDNGTQKTKEKRCPPHPYWIPRGEKVGTCIYCGRKKEFMDWEDIPLRKRASPYRLLGFRKKEKQ